MPNLPAPPPHSFEAESAVVGGLILAGGSSEILGDCIQTGLSPDDFFIAPYRETYRTILEMASSGTPVDLVTLKDELGKRRILSEQFTIEKLASSVETVPSSSTVPHYAKIVKRKAVERHLLRIHGDIGQRLVTGQELNGELEQLIQTARSLDTTNAPKDWKIGAKAKLTNAKNLETMVDQPIPYLIHPICVAGALTQIQGAPKGGKSSFALHISNCAANQIWPHPEQVSAERALKILYLAWEDPAIMMSKRLSLYNVGLGLDRKTFTSNIDFVFAPHIFVDQESGAANLLGAIQESKAEIVVIDTLSHIHSAESENDAVEMRIPMIRLYEIAQQTSVGMIYTHHTAKGSAEKEMHEKARGSVAIAAAWHICLDWGRREEGSDINPVHVQSKFEHEELKWEIAYLKMREDSTGAICGIKWDIQEKTRAQTLKERESIKERKRRIIFEAMGTMTITKEYATAREVADSCGLGLGEQSVRQILQSLCEEGKAISKTGPKGVAMFKPKLVQLPASS